MKISPLALKISLGSLIFLLAALWAGLYFYWANTYRDRIYPGIHIGDLDLGGTSREQAKNLLVTRTQKISDAGLVFQTAARSATLTTTVVSFDSDLSYPALSFENDRMVETAYGEHSDRTFFRYLLGWFKPAEQKRLPAIYSLDRDKIRTWLDENFPELNSEPANAYFSLPTGDKAGSDLEKNSEKAGQEINYDQLFADLNANLGTLQNQAIRVPTRSRQPEVSLSDLTGWEEEAEAVLRRGDLDLSLRLETGTKEREWTVEKETLITWLKTEKDSGRPTLGLDETKIAAYLREEIAPAVNQEAILPRFEMNEGRVTSWQTGRAGYRLDEEASAAQIVTEFSDQKNQISLLTAEITADNVTADNDFQIKEIIGTGHSRFSGSPVNRRHNIRVGAEALHGLLIKPDEEFSLLKALGEIDASTGYRTELVIKGNKTIPEYGGGLCQIGTTAFRSALASGLPITQRRNHSYRVSYYEPAGTDATIYDPAPDFRFLNDTGNYILIQSRIEGDDLYFDFWGVQDGRSVTMTDPVIYNIVKPAPTRIIETTDLAPGVKKCTESSHNGADAYFDYTVVYPEGATTTPVQTRRFSSHYVPWQAVCLVGAAASSTPPATGGNDDTSASSTVSN